MAMKNNFENTKRIFKRARLYLFGKMNCKIKEVLELSACFLKALMEIIKLKILT